MANQYWDYPKPDAQRSGCKVSWHYYRSPALAQQCAVAAKHNAVLDRAQGFDFGYCAPGSVRQCKPDEELVTGYSHNAKKTPVGGLWEVCIP